MNSKAHTVTSYQANEKRTLGFAISFLVSVYPIGGAIVRVILSLISAVKSPLF
jgi:hypothetical protein